MQLVTFCLFKIRIRVGDEYSVEDEFVTVTKESETFLSLPLQNRTSDPLHWWKDHAMAFPYIVKLARTFLATLTSSVYAERIFLKYDEIFEE